MAYTAPIALDPAVPVAAPRRLRVPVASPGLVDRIGAPLTVLALAIGAAIAASIWSFQTHSMLIYGDARAHLNVARHVTDGLRPGPTQLGSVWLPMPHILMVPLTVWRSLWHSGAAGAIVGGACYVYAAVRLFGLVEELTTIGTPASNAPCTAIEPWSRPGAACSRTPCGRRLRSP